MYTPSMYVKAFFNIKVLHTEYITLKKKYIIKYEKKYTDSFNPIIFINSFTFDSFSFTIL